MKFNKSISSLPRKQRKFRYEAPSHIRRQLMGCRLSKELRAKHNTRSVPIRKDDEVLVMTGKHANHEGKVLCVRRSKFKIHIERLTRDNRRGEARQIPVDPSNCVITKLYMDKDRQKLLDRKAKGKEMSD